MDTPHIERPNTVSGLIEKHREIAGQIEHHRQIMNALVFDLEALEHAIRIFDPDAALGRAKPVPSPHSAFRGEMRRDILSVLRTANDLLTSLDIARHVVMLRTGQNQRFGSREWPLHKYSGPPLAERPCWSSR